jgi:dipeptidyl aminopeptidase/acylaminoacyl peptidase
VTGRETKVDVGALSDRRVARADLLLRVTGLEAVRLVVRDAGTGQFAGLTLGTAIGSIGLADVPPEETVRLLALSPDGSHLLCTDAAIGGDRLLLHELATDTARTLPLSPDVYVAAATFHPAGDRVAALTQDGDRATVIVFDTGGHREVWSAEGGQPDNPAVSWSPDGRLLAITYLTPDDHDRTVVVDGDGATVAEFRSLGVNGISGRCWTGEQELLLTHEYWEDQERPPPLTLIDPSTGRRREITPEREGGFLGALDGRLLRPTDDSRGIESTALDGSDPRPVVDVGSSHYLSFFDAIPGALAVGA